MYTMILEPGEPVRSARFSAIKAAATPHTTQTDGSEEARHGDYRAGMLAGGWCY